MPACVSLSLYGRPSVCRSASRSLCPSVCLFVGPYVCLLASLLPTPCMPVRPSVRLPIVCQSVCLSACLSCLYVLPPAHPPVCLSAYFCMHARRLTVADACIAYLGLAAMAVSVEHKHNILRTVERYAVNKNKSAIPAQFFRSPKQHVCCVVSAHQCVLFQPRHVQTAHAKTEHVLYRPQKAC